MTDDQRKIVEMAKWTGACYHPDRNCFDRIGECSECSIPYTCENLFKAGYRKITNIEQVDATGDVVALPCKIGDPVWVVCRDLHDYILIQGFCCGFHIDEDGIRIITNVKCYDNDRMGNYTNKDEAKKRLAELNGGVE